MDKIKMDIILYGAFAFYLYDNGDTEYVDVTTVRLSKGTLERLRLDKISTPNNAKLIYIKYGKERKQTK